MQKGDAFLLPIKLSFGGKVVSDGEAKMMLGSLVKTLTYDATIECWTCQLTQAETLALAEIVPMQIAYKKDNNTIINSAIKNIAVNNSLFTQPWS